MDSPLSINTNGGLIKLHQKCDISYINDVWYNKNSIANIISMKDMMDKFRDMVYSKEELPFLVHMTNKIVKFRRFPSGLYAMDTNGDKSFVLIKQDYQFINTLEENLKCLSSRPKNEQRNMDNSTKQWELPRWMI